MQPSRTGSEAGSTSLVRLAIAALAAALVIIIIVQNAHTVSINVLVWNFEARLIWTLLAVALLGCLAGLLLPGFRR